MREKFQSLTRDSNHSNIQVWKDRYGTNFRFNPSRGIAIIQTLALSTPLGGPSGFNPSRGIAIIQTPTGSQWVHETLVSIPHAG